MYLHYLVVFEFDVLKDCKFILKIKFKNIYIKKKQS